MVTKLTSYGKPFFTLGKLQTVCRRCKELCFSTLGQLATVLVLYLSQIISKNLLGLQNNASFPLLMSLSTLCKRPLSLNRKEQIRANLLTGSNLFVTPKSILACFHSDLRTWVERRKMQDTKACGPSGTRPCACCLLVSALTLKVSVFFGYLGPHSLQVCALFFG